MLLELLFSTENNSKCKIFIILPNEFVNERRILQSDQIGPSRLQISYQSLNLATTSEVAHQIHSLCSFVHLAFTPTHASHSQYILLCIYFHFLLLAFSL